MKGHPTRIDFHGVVAEQYVSGKNIVIEKDGKYIIIPAFGRPSFNCKYLMSTNDLIHHVHEWFECC